MRSGSKDNIDTRTLACAGLQQRHSQLHSRQGSSCQLTAAAEAAAAAAAKWPHPSELLIQAELPRYYACNKLNTSTNIISLTVLSTVRLLAMLLLLLLLLWRFLLLLPLFLQQQLQHVGSSSAGCWQGCQQA
jgi:hypothetical protein